MRGRGIFIYWRAATTTDKFWLHAFLINANKRTYLLLSFSFARSVRFMKKRSREYMHKKKAASEPAIVSFVCSKSLKKYSKHLKE